MILQEPFEIILSQLIELISKLDRDAYKTEMELLSGSTLGKHFRHILNFYENLYQGFLTGVVCYDTRNRDSQIEEDPSYAKKQFTDYMVKLSVLPGQTTLQLEAKVEMDSEKTSLMTNTTVEREILYVIEHTIHHMAIIKMAVLHYYPKIAIPANLGVAFSTIRQTA
ncbi:MAG: DinB family protein [Spirochaetota bacterium]